MSGARARTFQRMRDLLVASTVVAACHDRTSCLGNGYAVVDPMPPPAGCAGLAAQVKITTLWKRVTHEYFAVADGGEKGADAGRANAETKRASPDASGYLLEITVTAPPGSNIDFTAPQLTYGRPADGGAGLTVESHDPTRGVYSIFVPERGAAAIGFSLPVTCAPGSEPPRTGSGWLDVQIQINVPGDPTVNVPYDR